MNQLQKNLNALKNAYFKLKKTLAFETCRKDLLDRLAKNFGWWS